MTGSDDKKRPTALNLTPARSPSTGSNSSSDSSLKHPRTPRFAEATSVHSPVEPTRSPFADPEKAQVVVQAQPADIGFGYINNGESQVPKTPLRSAMKIPGTPGRRFGNPMSPTFNEAEVLEKRELATDKEQARDLKIKTRVRMAKFALRGVNFSCSLIILCMLSSTFAIFNASKGLATQSSLPPWADGTNTWPQKLVLAMACVSLTACIIVFITFFRRGHKRAEKVNTYYHMFAIGWFIVSLVLWGVTAALYQNSRNNSNNKDMWGWSCVNNKRESIFEDQVNYQLICRLQNWAMICIIIEVVIEVLCIILYSVVFYRYYTKRRLAKTMDNRDRARSDLYLAQLRAQSAPNTPGFGPKSPALSQYAMSPRHPPAAYRNLGDIEESPFTPGGKIHEPTSQFNSPKPDFKLQAPPKKAPSATPKTEQSPFTPVSGQSPFSPTTESGPSSNNQNNQNTTTIADDEPVYDAVPIPGAYAGQAYKPHLEQR